MYLLRFISDRALHREVTACTNIVESYHHFLDWLFFGKDGVITDNDTVETDLGSPPKIIILFKLTQIDVSLSTFSEIIRCEAILLAASLKTRSRWPYAEPSFD